MSAARFYVVYVMAAVLALGVFVGGPALLLTPVLVFGLIPLADYWLGNDRDDPDDAQLEQRASNLAFDLAVRLWVPTQLALIAASLWRVSSGVSLLEGILLAVALGVLTGGGGINVAHELMHRADKRDRALAEILMGSVTYTWFCVEHVLGHHRHVATPQDAASSRFGETFWVYLPRVVLNSARSAWRIEGARVARRGLTAGSWQDRRARYLFGLVAYYGAVALLGWPGLALIAGQSLIAIALVEVINYVEHYGLERREISPGRYERVGPQHSWNSNHALTSAFLFNLPRHADHHANASRPYWALRAFPDAPELPLGYPTMVLIALVPPLWFRIMDPRVRALQPSPAPRPATL